MLTYEGGGARIKGFFGRYNVRNLRTRVQHSLIEKYENTVFTL